MLLPERPFQVYWRSEHGASYIELAVELVEFSSLVSIVELPGGLVMLIPSAELVVRRLYGYGHAHGQVEGIDLRVGHHRFSTNPWFRR